ncbi:MAG: hypothetical protein GXP42_10665 [Chloroflexi bacterium]|nr:hypothetical protein [Chloroflexota bacterium]
MSTPEDIASQIAAGVAGRLRLLTISIDRLDRLESGSGQWLSNFAHAELPEAAQELTLRALRTATEPTNFALLRALSAAESRSLGQLMEAVGLGRLTLTERLNDLIQVGLASRNIDTDHAQISSAGLALTRWLEGLISAVAQNYTEMIDDSN